MVQPGRGSVHSWEGEGLLAVWLPMWLLARPRQGAGVHQTNIYAFLGNTPKPHGNGPKPPLRTGADRCTNGPDAGNSVGVNTGGRIRSNRAEEREGRRRLDNAEADAGRRVHTARNTPSRNAGRRPKLLQRGPTSI